MLLALTWLHQARWHCRLSMKIKYIPAAIMRNISMQESRCQADNCCLEQSRNIYSTAQSNLFKQSATCSGGQQINSLVDDLKLTLTLLAVTIAYSLWLPSFLVQRHLESKIVAIFLRSYLSNPIIKFVDISKCITFPVL